MSKSTPTSAMISNIVWQCLRCTDAIKTDTYHLHNETIGWSVHQSVEISANNSKTNQMSQAYRIAANASEVQGYPMVKASLNVDLNEPFKGIIVIRGY